MNNHSKLLKETFLDISNIVYDLLEVFNSEENNIRQLHEDAISSIILKKLAKLKTKGIFVKTKSLDVLETNTGIDFDIWIGENDEKYIRFLAQAKSFGNNTTTNNKYDMDAKQCEKLIAASKREHKAFPLYFLYQHINDINLQNDHFSFLEEFTQEHSSITFASAFNIKKQIANKNLKFSEIHKNDFKSKWNNDLYNLFENKIENIGLPLHLLYDISPTKIEKFQNLIANKNNSLGFFFFFIFQDFPFEIHTISHKDIDEIYGSNSIKNENNVKNLIIINDSQKAIREQLKIFDDKLA